MAWIFLEARRGAEGVDQLCGAAEKISRQRASSKYNRERKAEKIQRREEKSRRPEGLRYRAWG